MVESDRDSMRYCSSQGIRVPSPKEREQACSSSQSRVPWKLCLASSEYLQTERHCARTTTHTISTEEVRHCEGCFTMRCNVWTKLTQNRTQVYFYTHGHILPLHSMHCICNIVALYCEPSKGRQLDLVFHKLKCFSTTTHVRIPFSTFLVSFFHPGSP